MAPFLGGQRNGVGVEDIVYIRTLNLVSVKRFMKLPCEKHLGHTLFYAGLKLLRHRTAMHEGDDIRRAHSIGVRLADLRVYVTSSCCAENLYLRLIWASLSATLIVRFHVDRR